jgi:hypothetical protein
MWICILFGGRGSMFVYGVTSEVDEGVLMGKGMGVWCACSYR